MTIRDMASVCAVLAITALAALSGCSPEQTGDGDGAAGEQAALSEREIERITALGYVSGRNPAVGPTGGIGHDATRSFDGYTLFTFAEGPAAVLIDMAGNEVHTWVLPGSKHWSRAHLCPNGDVLVLSVDPSRLMRLDRDSRLVWQYPGTAHHDFDVLDDGTIWVLVRDATTRENIHNGAWLLDDMLVHLDPGGSELERVSLLETFESSDQHNHWVREENLPEGHDIFHANSVQVLDGGGRALVSIRELSILVMIDLRGRSVEWVLNGAWHKQHEAELCGERILLFDNLGLGEQSRVLELNAFTGEIVWEYTEPGFFSQGAGAQQRLANGNTLITESDAGRIIEVEPGGETVWEYVNPRTVSDDPGCTLGIMRAVRLPRDFPMDWLRPRAFSESPSP